MTEKEKRLLKVLVGMTEQYLRTKEGRLDHQRMNAGEDAIELLAEYGLVLNEGRNSRWTDAGWQLYMSD